MADRLGVPGQAVGGRFRSEDLVDDGKYRRGGTVRQFQLHLLQTPAGIGHGGAEMIAHEAEIRRIGVLEAVDGLLLVANGENGALEGPFTLAGAFAGIEVPGQSFDHLPLGGAGVLGLVDKNMVDAAVELVMDPRHPVSACQQLAGLFDQVVVIEQGAGLLDRLIGVDQRHADDQKRRRRLGQGYRLQAFQHRRHPVLFGQQRVQRLGVGLPGFLSDEVAFGARATVLIEEDAPVSVLQGRGSCRRLLVQPIADLGGPVLVGLFTLVEGGGGVR